MVCRARFGTSAVCGRMNQPFRNLLPTPTSALRRLGQVGLIAAGFAGLVLSSAPVRADISVNVQLEGPPPPPRQEVIVERDRPGPDYVWVGGYWGGAPGHYAWTNGHWDRPPHGHGHWVAPRWENHGGHYVQVRGEWRD
jgi:hypothetical protein